MARSLREIKINFRITKKEFEQILFLADKLEINNSDVLREGLRLLYEREVNNIE